MSIFSYKRELDATVDRHRRFWGRQMSNEILAAVKALDGTPFIDPNTVCPDVPKMFEAWDHSYRLRQEIIDDLLPVARVSFGSAAFGAFLGADISFEHGIGWAYPFMESFDQLVDLEYNPQTDWIQNQVQACRYFVEHAADKFPLCEMEPNDGLNFAEAVRGSQAYRDVYDFPDELHRLLAFASDFNIRFMDLQRENLAPNLYYQDGIFSMFRIWLPGRTPWMSVDAYGNCAPWVFREFGAPYLQRMMDYYDGGWIHVHAHALHLLPEITRLDKVVGIGIFDDPNARRGFEQLADIRRVTGSIPLQIDCRAEELERGLADRSLPGNVMYMVKGGISTIAEANRLMEAARAYRSVD